MVGTQPRSTRADAELDCQGPSQATAAPQHTMHANEPEEQEQEMAEEAWGTNGPLASTHESISLRHNLGTVSQTLGGDGSPLMASGATMNTRAAVQPPFLDEAANEEAIGKGVVRGRESLDEAAGKRSREDGEGNGSLDLCKSEENQPMCKRVRASSEDGDDHGDSGIENGDGCNTGRACRNTEVAGGSSGDADNAAPVRSSVGALAEMLTALKRPDDESLDAGY
jgi:hypothetical protein